MINLDFCLPRLTAGLWMEPGAPPTKDNLTNYPLKCESELSQNLRYFDKAMLGASDISYNTANIYRGKSSNKEGKYC